MTIDRGVITEAADLLRELLDRVEAGELAASGTFVARVEGAIATLRAIAAEDGGEAIPHN
jgi:hypothetical protein